MTSMLVAGLLMACGSGDGSSAGDDDDDDDPSAASSSGGGASGSRGETPRAGGETASAKFSCCLNDVYFACESRAAFDKCAGGDPRACFDDCDPRDGQCMSECFDQQANATHDPSDCEERAGEKCPSSPTTASCNGLGSRACDVDVDCGSGAHCTGGKCYDNEQGSKCDVDVDCGSGNHCTSGCCLSNAQGAPCDVDVDCGSGNHCTSGTCYANESGAPCDVDVDCGSGSSCAGGTCN